MARPVLQKINPFDATKPYEISISWAGNRAYANRIVIYDNATSDIVFDHTVSTFALTHTIPAHALINGKKYVIQAQMFDVDHEASALSEKVLFFTFATPEFYFSNIPDSGIINGTSFNASVHYYSSDSEDLESYKFYLYDSTKKQLIESGTLTDQSAVHYSYNGLANNASYYVRCAGVTVNGMYIDTGYVAISVRYEDQNGYARIYAKPILPQGCVQVASNLTIISYAGAEEFEYADGMINLTDKTLYYDSGFLIEGDFTTIIRGTSLWGTYDIFRMNNGVHNVTVSSRVYTNGKLRFKLLAQNGIFNYLIYSDELTFNNEDIITIVIRRKGNVYQIRVFVELETDIKGDMWYGLQRPNMGANKYDRWINVGNETYKVENYTEHLDTDEPLDANVGDAWIGGA